MNEKSITIENWRQYFPFEKIRPMQETAINFILNSFVNADKRVVVTGLPVGSGKSAIAMTVAGYYKAQLKKSYFLTTQVILQQQYMKDFASHGLVLLKSASSYTCQMHCDDVEKKSCIDIKRLIKGKNVLKQLYKDCNGPGCVYAQAKEEFFNGYESITNYAYFLATNAHSYQKMPYRDLLILDEGHNIEAATTSFVQVSFSNKFYKKTLDVKMPAMNADQETVFKWLTGTCRRKLVNLIRDLKAIEHPLSQSPEAQEAAEHTENLEKNLKKLDYFKVVYDPKTWVLDVSRTDMRGERIYEFKPIQVGVYVRNLLLDYAEKTLILSATVIDNEMFCEANGIKPDEVAYMELPSTFPVENRLLHVLPVGSMSRKNIEVTLPNMAEVIQALIDQHAGEKGIIHCIDAKTAVLLSNGTQKPISELAVGEIVVSYNENRNVFEDQSVLAVIDKGFQECLELQFENGKTLVCTPDHLILTQNRGWTKACELDENDDIVDSVNDTYINAFSHSSKTFEIR